MKKLMRHVWFKILLRAVVSGVLLGILLRQLNLRDLVGNFQNLTVSFVLLAWVYYALCEWLSAYRWQLLLAAKRVYVRVSKLFAFYLVSMFLNNFMPGGLGGDVVKTYDLYRYTGQGRVAVVSVFLERFTGLAGLSILSIAALAIGFQHLHSPLILAIVGGTALLLAVVVMFVWWPPLAGPFVWLLAKLFPWKIGEQLQKLHSALAGYRHHWKTLLATVGLSVIIQFMFAVYFGIVAYALNVAIDVRYFILFLPIISLATALPISIGGLGVREATMVYLFAGVGVAAEDVVAVGLTAQLIATLFSCWGGLVLLLRKPVSVSAGVRQDG